jgi:hypothetical protein
MRNRSLAALALIIGVLVMSLGPAGARVVEREHYSGTFSGKEESCGHAVHFEGTYSGLAMVKMRGTQPIPYFFNNFKVREVFTLADGRGYVLEQAVHYRDLRITHVRGTIYRFTSIEAGQVFNIETLDGRVVERNRGLLVHSFLVDTRGDSDPFNDVYLEESLVKDAGKHIDAYESDEEFCANIDAAIQG